MQEQQPTTTIPSQPDLDMINEQLTVDLVLSSYDLEKAAIIAYLQS